jgi:hypothetical protein
MGQYHQVYNLTKKETFSPHALNEGAKLLEWAVGGTYTAGLAVLLCNSNGRGGGDLNLYAVPKKDADGNWVEDADGNIVYDYTPEQAEHAAAIAQVAGRWAGDRIVVQGDYAAKGDPAFISDKCLKGFTDISDKVVAALRADSYLAEKLDDK